MNGASHEAVEGIIVPTGVRASARSIDWPRVTAGSVAALVLLASVFYLWSHRSVRVPPGTILSVELTESLSADQAVPSQEVSGSIAQTVFVKGREVIPQGAPAMLQVTSLDHGRYAGVSRIAVSLIQVTVQGRTYQVST